MRKSFIAVALAAALAATSFPVGAFAQSGPYPYYGRYSGQWYGGHHRHGPRWYYGGRYHRHHYRHYDPGPAIVAGAIFGMMGAAIANQGYRSSYAGPRSHVAWCQWRYKTYNPSTDTYFARPGVPARCNSPY